MRSVLVAVTVVANLAVAHAQAPGELAPPTEVTLHKKDPNKATLLTGLGIAVPAALLTLGVTSDIDEGGVAGMGFALGWFLPAWGHWYAGRVGTYGMLGRMGGVVFFMAGVSEIDDAKKCARGIEVTDGCDGVSRGVGRAAIGLGVSLARLRLRVLAWRSARVQLAPQDPTDADDDRSLDGPRARRRVLALDNMRLGIIWRASFRCETPNLLMTESPRVVDTLAKSPFWQDFNIRATWNGPQL